MPDALSFTHTTTATCIAGGHSIEPLTLVRHTITMVALERQHGTNQQAGDHRDSMVLCLQLPTAQFFVLADRQAGPGTYDLVLAKAFLQGTALSAGFTLCGRMEMTDCCFHAASAY